MRSVFNMIVLSATLAATSSVGRADTVTVDNHSFEAQVASLPTPLLFPPLSGDIADWHLERSALGGVTGLTVPQIGFIQSSAATDGNNIARILFVAGVVAEASFSQSLGVQLEPNSRYVLQVDLGSVAAATLLADAEVRVYAGNVLMASSEDASLLTVLDLKGSLDTYRLRFCSGANPPTGEVRIVLRASSVVSVLSGVAFENVRFDINPFDCPCNFNGDCYLNSQDFFDFLTAFFSANPSSDINADGLHNSQDFFDFCTCFLNAPPQCY